MSENVRLIREKYQSVLQRIAQSAKSSGRKPEEIKLVVVSKAQSIEKVKTAVEAGIRIFGENYPEEAVKKIQAFGEQSGVEWHMIGHVQSRKAELVAKHFRLLHSLDSLQLARRLDRLCTREGVQLPVLLEFNLGGESSKSGWAADEEERWPEILAEITEVADLGNLQVRGLMAMPPLGKRAEDSRPYFQRLKKMQSFLIERVPQVGWQELSMGTSLDYEVAVESGATLVRVGTAIMGARD